MSSSSFLSELFDPGRWSVGYLVKYAFDPAMDSSAMVHIPYAASHGFLNPYLLIIYIGFNFDKVQLFHISLIYSKFLARFPL